MTVKTEIAERLRAIMAKELKKDVNSITATHTLREDLGLNSLDAIELMFKIEEEFDLSIPDEDMQKLARVGDVITYLEGRLNQATRSAAAKSSRGHSVKALSPASAKAPPKKGSSQRHAAAKPKKATPRSPKLARSPAKHPKPKGSRGHA